MKRFWDKVDRSGDCWLWTAGTTTDGYGVFQMDGKPHRAHRLSYRWLVGVIPDGLQIDHLCRVRNCVRPSHLEPVTAKVNTLRGNTLARINRDKTECKHGHAFSPENTKVTRAGKRQCRICLAVNLARFRAKRRAAVDIAGYALCLDRLETGQ